MTDQSNRRWRRTRNQRRILREISRDWMDVQRMNGKKEVRQGSSKSSRDRGGDSCSNEQSERVVCLPKETCPDSSTGYVPPVYILNQRRFCNPKLQSREAFQLMSGNRLLTVAELLELGRGVQIRKRWPIVYCSMEEIQAFAARVIEQRFFRKLDVDEGDHTRNADNPSFVDCSLPTPLHHADNSNGFLPASCHISLKTHQLPILVNGLVLSRMTYLTLELPSPQISGLSAHEGARSLSKEQSLRRVFFSLMIDYLISRHCRLVDGIESRNTTYTTTLNRVI
ncbi:hypothetical protein F5878DRAFT_647426 [Lentinula raphanica]|uniref:Uncharacterized protein n=1 Tax=Lentinula raphanica TaxID=153919 RepID=A0AA38NW14_9AGAR|nr:hypothetical protein F5878DRAFT_647426 [Lentinula raphanica]